MELSFSPNAAATRLRRLSQRIFGASPAEPVDELDVDVRAGEHPYYLHTPRSDAEPAPGWYWKPKGAEHPQYLGHNSFDAEYKLRRKLDELRENDKATA